MELKIEKGIFKKFSLEEISNALEKGLSKNYDSVNAEVIENYIDEVLTTVYSKNLTQIVNKQRSLTAKDSHLYII